MVTRRDERIARLASGSSHGGRLKTGDDAPQFVETIKVDLIDPDPEQPRRDFDQSALQEMAESLLSRGQIQPIVVIKAGDRFTISVGERRWRASKIAGLPTIKALVRATPFEARDSLVTQIVENEQRRGLSPSELVRAVARLSALEMTGKEIAAALGKSTSRVSELLRLSEAPPEIAALVDAIGPVNAYSLLRKWRDHQAEAAELIGSMPPELITRPLIETIGIEIDAPHQAGKATEVAGSGQGATYEAAGQPSADEPPTVQRRSRSAAVPDPHPTMGRMIVDHAEHGHGHVVFGRPAAPGHLLVLFEDAAEPLEIALTDLRAVETFSV